MRISERLNGLKDWTFESVCKGRSMKAPVSDRDLSQIKYQEPTVYLGWAPARVERTDEIASVVPSIIIMPNQAHAKYMKEKRFDRYNGVHRPQELGANLSVNVLFSVFEPGIRLPGFKSSVGKDGQGANMSKFLDGTEEGLRTLLDWMDDYVSLLLGQRMIPHTDLFVDEESVTYNLYTDQSYVTDRRPIYYGFVNAVFDCYAEEQNSSIEKYLN